MWVDRRPDTSALIHPRHTLIVFCLADCWMRRNAAWRLSRVGYRDVRWFAEGRTAGATWAAPSSR
jgi:hypothetical protein